MQLVPERCCGRDVHQKSVVVCGLIPREDATLQREIPTSTTMTADLLLRNGLEALDIRQVAMESTAVFWHPISNILEDEEPTSMLVNAQHLKAVPGRKTDVKESEWLADLLRQRLLKASFIPPAPSRELRELTRSRKTLVQERASEINRLQKVLESATLKLAAVASDLLGKSGRDMLDALVGGQEDAEMVAAWARGRLRAQLQELQRALEGRVKPHHRFLLEQILSHIDFLDQALAKVSQEVERCLTPFDSRRDLASDDPLHLRDRCCDHCVTDWCRYVPFPFCQASGILGWSVCWKPTERRQTTRDGTATKGDVWLRTVLAESAGSLARSPGSYLHAQDHRIARRGGKQKAVWAVAHSVVVSISQILSTKQSSHDLGAEYFEQLEAPRRERHHVRQLEQLGYTLTLSPKIAYELARGRFSREPAIMGGIDSWQSVVHMSNHEKGIALWQTWQRDLRTILSCARKM